LPGALPGLLGVIAFGGIKFLGYSLSAWLLKKYEPAVKSHAIAIAGVRTVLGAVLGPVATILLVSLIGLVVMHPDVPPFSPQNFALELPEIYCLLFIIRILVWALVLVFFTRKSPISRTRFWLYAVWGAIVSTLLDWPGYALALAAPGRIVFC